MTDEVRPLGLVEMLMRSRRMRTKLLAEHSPDGSAHCRSCRSVGCTLGNAAREARRRLAEPRHGGRGCEP